MRFGFCQDFKFRANDGIYFCHEDEIRIYQDFKFLASLLFSWGWDLDFVKILKFSTNGGIFFAMWNRFRFSEFLNSTLCSFRKDGIWIFPDLKFSTNGCIFFLAMRMRFGFFGILNSTLYFFFNEDEIWILSRVEIENFWFFLYAAD